MEYTKGKWGIMEKSPLFYDIGNGSDRTALVPVIVLNAEANACLIAAAPDMYEALRKIVKEGTRCIDTIQQDKPVREIYNIDEVDRIARLALAKAEGNK